MQDQIGVGSSRRDFLRGTAAAAMALPLSGAGFARAPAPAAKKLLILGGTAFLGPAIVESALARGHEVTLFNRGRTNPQLFPDVEKIRGNRRRPTREDQPEQDLKGLEGRQWDAVIDTSGYYTRNVEDTAKLLADSAEQYVFVSSISVYRELGASSEPIDEDSELATCDDKYASSMGKGWENYGPLKAYCEQAVEQFFPGRSTAVRPGYIVGPRDRSGRFHYWPLRLARGGEVLAPGARDAERQFVDVRDLGEWIVLLCERGTAGPFNATGFKGRISTQELLHTGKGTLNHECSFTWVEDDFLMQHEVRPWGDLPWTPQKMFNHSANERAIAAGLTFRRSPRPCATPTTG